MPGAPAFCGTHTAGAYERGGAVAVGMFPKATFVQWGRVRDEISEAIVHVPLDGCCDLLEQIEPVQNELHIFRDGESVWQGVITRMEFEYDEVQIYAEDMLWVAKRRVLEVGYNYQDPCATCTPGPIEGTGRISAITHAGYLLDTWCYSQYSDEWNMAAHLFPIVGPDDPMSGRQANAWSTSCWLEFDSLAEDNGIDYTVVNRDIYWFDTNLDWNTLDPLDPADIASYPRIVEYGNSLATRYIRGDGSGYAGVATAPAPMQAKYGQSIDIISAERTQAETGEQPSDPSAPPPPPSAAKLAAWLETAEGRVADRYPVARNIVIPANSTLMPTSPWDVNTLMPGSWCEVSLDRLCRPDVTELQRLHEMRVTERGGEAEQIEISMITAPATRLLPEE